MHDRAVDLAERIQLLRASDIASSPDGLVSERTPWGFIERYDVNPGYFEGNRIVLDAAPSSNDTATWVSKYRELFPERNAYPAVVTWYDEPDALPPSMPEIASYIGFLHSNRFNSSVKSLPTDVPLIPGRGRAFWAALEQLETAAYPYLAAFNAWRISMFRQLAESGRGVFYGLARGDQLVAAAGAFADSEACRFGTVVTAAGERRRGFASALLRAICDDFTARGRPIVIVAETGSTGECTYRAAGFKPFIAIRTLTLSPTSNASLER